MKITIAELIKNQKIIIEAMKIPMKWETVNLFDKFLNDVSKVVAQAQKDFDLEGKAAIIEADFKKEIEEMTEKMKAENPDKTPEELQQELQQKIGETRANEASMKLNEEFSNMEVEINSYDYVLDEMLPALLNITLSRGDMPMFKFRLRKAKKSQ